MTIPKKIVVTGANGQLGSELKTHALDDASFKWVFTDKYELDLTDLENLAVKLSKISPDVIVNCAAHTAVDRAEDEVVLSDILNNKAVGIIAEWTAKNDCKLIHISTDYVFDGNSKIPLKENANTNPINTYGKTKLAGELSCLKNNPEALIIRTSWLYSSFGNNFVKAIIGLLEEGNPLSIIDDQIGSPTYAGDLAEVIIHIINSPSWKSGIFNFSNEGEISWYGFSKAIKEIGAYDCVIHSIASDAYPTKAKRPKYSLLDKTKIKNTFNIEVPFYKDSLKKCINLIQHGN